jgi:hypothetical protein
MQWEILGVLIPIVTICMISGAVSGAASASRYAEVLQRLYRRNVFNPVKLGLSNSERYYGFIARVPISPGKPRLTPKLNPKLP